jgi:tripartite-type tricarboxylate transporter receptor subunit TctC
MSGQIQLLADPMLSSLPLAQAGKIKALGLTSLKRSAAAPDIPTVEESGMKGFEFVSWYGMWAPKNLPADISARLQTEIAKVLSQPEMKQRLATLGFEPIGSTSDHFAKYIDEEMAKYEKIIRDAHIKPE